MGAKINNELTTTEPGARQFVENHFADTTFGRIRLLVDATFGRVRHLFEKKNGQVRHLIEIVKSLFFDQTSYSTQRLRTDSSISHRGLV